jgi:melanoma-associated antigen
MAVSQRKRRAVSREFFPPESSSNNEQPIDEPESASEAEARAEKQGNRARLNQSPVSDDAYDEGESSGPSTKEAVETLARKLVRYALSCEYARQPIRRADIAQKVLATNGRQFKHVFGEAQHMLQHTFGMEMTELPTKEKVTLQQRRGW